MSFSTTRGMSDAARVSASPVPRGAGAGGGAVGAPPALDPTTVALAKRICDGEDLGAASAVVAKSLLADLNAAAGLLHADAGAALSHDQCFARITAAGAGREVLAAHQILARPRSVVSTQATIEKGATSDVQVLKSWAYDRVEQIAKKLQRDDPRLSDAQAFARAFADPANAALAAASLGKASAAEEAAEDDGLTPARGSDPPMTVGLKRLYALADDFGTTPAGKGLSHAQRVDRVMRTPGGQALYRQHKSEISQL
jgi:hypothetical protein